MSEPAPPPEPPEPALVRREIAARQTQWARAMAAALARAGVRPNAISLASIAFAAASGACLVWAWGAAVPARIALYLAAVVLLQGRLLCNLFDGMVAIEHGRKTPSGAIFNDFPDRLADPLILVGAGYAIASLRGGIELGWLAGLLAVLTAYVRVLAGSAGATQSFAGPMAKQHRMALMTAALAAAALTAPRGWDGQVLRLALALIVAGCAITVLRRLFAAIRELESKEEGDSLR